MVSQNQTVLVLSVKSLEMQRNSLLSSMKFFLVVKAAVECNRPMPNRLFFYVSVEDMENYRSSFPSHTICMSMFLVLWQYMRLSLFLGILNQSYTETPCVGVHSVSMEITRIVNAWSIRGVS